MGANANEARLEGPALGPVARALPPHRADQDQVYAMLAEIWRGHADTLRRVKRLLSSVEVRERRFSLPLAEYARLGGFGRRNQAYKAAAAALVEEAIAGALVRAKVAARDVGHLFLASTTGVATPTVEIDALARLGIRPDVLRTPLFGLGCGAGAAAIARAADWLRAYPDSLAVVCCVELCSLTFQPDDRSPAALVGAALFGDAAAAVVLAGARRPEARGPRIAGAMSRLYPGTERLAGWDVVDSGFKLVLDASLPDFWREHLRPDVDGFLAAHGLARAGVAHWVVHTGGPKILEAFEQALELPRAAIERSWRALRYVGNVSSASVLLVAAELQAEDVARPGDSGVLLAMGPGLSAEAVLLRW